MEGERGEGGSRRMGSTDSKGSKSRCDRLVEEEGWIL